MSCVSLPCPNCNHIWEWGSNKDPKTAFCPKGYGCASEHGLPESIDEKLDEIKNRLDKIEQN